MSSTYSRNFTLASEGETPKTPGSMSGGGSLGNSPPANFLCSPTAGLGGGSGSIQQEGSGAAFQRSNSAGNMPGNNNVRGMNPVFCLSPRAFNDDALSASANTARQETPRRVMSLLLDKEKPPRKEVCDVSLAEERHLFLLNRCLALLTRMSPSSIIQHLIPVIVACLENDDENHDQPEDSSIELVARCLPSVFDAVQTSADLSMSAAFIMPIMHLCTAADRRTVPIVSKCFQYIIERMKEEAVEALMVPIVHQLRYSICSLARAIAAGVLHSIAARPAVLHGTNTTIAKWFSYYVEASKDPCPIVREAAVATLGCWVDVAQNQRISLSELPFPLLHELMGDDLSDTVRYLLVDRLLEIATKIGKASTTKYICPSFFSAVKDRSWRVRYRAARCLGQLASCVVSPDEVLGEAVFLSKDEEVEIRAAVAEQLGAFVPLVSSSVGKDVIVPTAMRLAEDDNRVVQLHMIAHIAPLVAIDLDTSWVVCKRIISAMEKNDIQLQAHAVSSVCALIEILHQRRAGISTKEQMFPGIATSQNSNSADPYPFPGSASNRLKAQRSDASSTNSSFTGTRSSQITNAMGHTQRSNSMTKLQGSGSGKMSPSASNSSPAVGSGSVNPSDPTHEIVLSFVDRLTHMSRSGTWRVREAVLSCIPSFALVLPPEQFQKLNSILRRLVLDPVSKVRQTATEALKNVAERAGPSWTVAMAQDLLTGELGMSLQHSAVWRLLTIRCLTALLPTAALLDINDSRRAKLATSTLKILQQYTEDKVPTVQSALAEVLEYWLPWFSHSSLNMVGNSPNTTRHSFHGGNSSSSSVSHDELQHFFRLSVRKLESLGYLKGTKAAALLGITNSSHTGLSSTSPSMKLGSMNSTSSVPRPNSSSNGLAMKKK